MEKAWLEAYATLTACITRGIHVSVRLRDGETVAKYRAYDIVAPRGVAVHIDMSQAVLRGIVWADRGRQVDRFITIRDIETVREERVASRYFADDGFSEHNPIPEGWVRVVNCREPEFSR
jgi:hypothetical protein